MKTSIQPPFIDLKPKQSARHDNLECLIKTAAIAAAPSHTLVRAMMKTTTQGILEDKLSEFKNSSGPRHSPTSADTSGREIQYILLTLCGFFRGSSFLDLIAAILLMRKERTKVT